MDVITKLIEMFKKQSTVTPQMLMDMEGMRQRNQARIEQIKIEMGDKYILADCHKKARLDTPRPV
jgi:hypothetical protein